MKAFELQQRNITIAGKSTTLRLENCYWVLLEEVAKNNEISWQEQCLRILQRKPSSYTSRAGFLRAWCSILIYKQLQTALAELKQSQRKP